MANEVAYGFLSLEALFARRVADDDVGIEVVRGAIDLSVQEYNRVTDALFATIGIRRTTQAQYRYYSPGTGVEMQPLDQHGTPFPVVGYPGTYYDVGLPIRGAGTAWGTNRVARALQTVQEANDHVVNALRADVKWMRRHFLAAFMHKENYNWEDPEFGTLAVKALANGDASTYWLTNNTLATDNHYLFQAAAIADATNPFPDIRTELLEHPENAGATVVVYVPTNRVEEIMDLTDFLEVPDEDPDIDLATEVDRLTNNGAQYLAFGTEVLGKVSRCWIVHWDALPDDYMLALAWGAEDIVAMREYDAGALRGLIAETHSPDGARIENRLIRYAGWGINNRVGAAVFQVENASFVTPTGYEAIIAN